MAIRDTGDNGSTKSNLSNGVGISISLPLTIVSTKMSISSISIMSVSNSSYNPNIVWVSSSECVVDRKSMSNLADGVGITVSFTLAIESTVANGTIASDMAIPIVNTSDNTIAIAMGHLANCVGVTVTVDSGNSQEDK